MNLNYLQQGKRLLTVTKIPPAARRSGRAGGYLHLILVIVMATMLINGRTARYFRPALPPADPCQIKELGNLPERESWHGFVFNGDNVGFLHMKIEYENYHEGRRYRQSRSHPGIFYL